MLIIYLTILIIYVVLILWSLNNLGKMPIAKKIIYILVNLLIVFIFTNISYIISKQNIQYESQEIMNNIKTVLLLLFTGINGIITIPISCKQISELQEENIDKTKFTKRIILIFVVLLIIAYLECGYMETTQKGILQIMTNIKEWNWICKNQK